METAAFIASVVSICIAVFAVWLAITFYKMATKVSEGIKDAAKNISSGVDRLEKIFDRLYADTFGMVRDTFTDMRKHVWSGEKLTEVKVSEEEVKKAEEKVGKLKADFQDQIKGTLSKQKITNEKYDAILQTLSKLAEKTIAYSRKVDSEAREETLKNNIIHYFQKLPKDKVMRAWDVVVELREKYNLSSLRTLDELMRLKKEGIIIFKGEIQPKTIIKVK